LWFFPFVHMIMVDLISSVDLFLQNFFKYFLVNIFSGSNSDFSSWFSLLAIYWNFSCLHCRVLVLFSVIFFHI
jgi:hypothetical protein